MPTYTLEQALTHFLAPQCLYGCLILAAPRVATLATAVECLSAIHDWPRLSVGRELSAVLLHEPPRARARVTARWLRARAGELGPVPVICVDLDLLFAPALDLDPLSLCCQIGRTSPLVLVWPGSYQAGTLTYAVPRHAHYRIWQHPEAIVVNLEGET
ncbi:MAG: BREX-3 system P-loop-containing protein BrxF [Anaerolineae bacterium]|nr:BREX-3 system P-loop-containing protein BrxF [Anaerolineae bacterium]